MGFESFFTFAPRDGTVDYDGASGMHFDLAFEDSASGSHALSEREKAFFSLSRDGGRSVSLPLSVSRSQQVSNPAIDTDFSFRGSVDVKLVYVYEAE